jgi:glycosyltransferase involved in cell wall biosynthesis
MKNKKLTLAIFAKNEESVLEQALSSIIDCVDDIVFVDTGSTDRTVEIAQKFTKNIHHFTWCNDFSAARNFTESFIKDGYVMHWDADWILEPVSKLKLLKLKKDNFGGADMVFFSIINTSSDLRDRDDIITKQIIHDRLKFHWESPVHNLLCKNDESQEVTALYKSEIGILHVKDPNLKSNRYAQTLGILDDNFYEFRELIQKHLITFYGDGLMHAGRYGDVIKLCEFGLGLISGDGHKITRLLELLLLASIETGQLQNAITKIASFAKDLGVIPNYVLLFADCYSYMDPKAAVSLYKEFLEQKYTMEDLGGYFNNQRHLDHPKSMIQKLSKKI